MTKVAVTGGAGFIGSNLVRRLLSEGFEVTVIDDLSTGLITNLDINSVAFHKISITDAEKLTIALKNCDAIFHFAARGSVPRSVKNPVATHEVNATGTLNVLEGARKNGSHVIFSSSSSVYGRNMQLPKNEAMWLAPMTPYAASKLAAEGYVQSYSSSYAVPTTLLRFFNVFGPRQRPDHEYAAVLPKWIWLAMHGNPIDVYGVGDTSRDFTYVDTVVDIAMMAFKEKIVCDGPINLAYGNRISLNDVVKLLQIYFPDLRVNFKESRVGDVKESQNSPDLLTSLFPTVAPKPFTEALSETIDWLKRHGTSVANGPKTQD
jgi:UDP-glucose 4-epimerase